MRKKSRKLRSLLSSLVILALVTMMIPAGVFAEETAAVPVVAGDEALGNGEADSLDTLQPIVNGKGYFEGKYYEVVANTESKPYTTLKETAAGFSTEKKGADSTTPATPKISAGNFRLAEINSKEEQAFIETLLLSTFEATRPSTTTDMSQLGTYLIGGEASESTTPTWKWASSGKNINAVYNNYTGNKTPPAPKDSALVVEFKSTYFADSNDTDTLLTVGAKWTSILQDVTTATGHIVEQKSPSTAPNFSVALVELGSDGSETIVNSAAVAKDDQKTFKLVMTPANPSYNFSDADFLFASSDKDVAVVSSSAYNGNSNTFTVWGLEAGTSRITASIAGTDKVATCDITVGLPIQSIFITQDGADIGDAISMPATSTKQLGIGFKPINSVDKNITWESSDSKIAKVDANGLVTTLKEGQVTITAISNLGEPNEGNITEIKDTLIINVNAGPTKTVVIGMKEYRLYDVSTSWIDADRQAMDDGGHLVSVNTKEEQAAMEELIKSGEFKNYWLGGTTKAISDKPIEGTWCDKTAMTFTNWDTDLSEPARISGKVSLKKSNGKWVNSDGAEQITTGFIVEIDVPVVAVTEITLSEETLSFDLGTKPEPVKLTTTTKPANANNADKLVWSSSDSRIAAVDPVTGVVTPLSAGTATITARVGNVTAACEVTVTAPAIVTSRYKTHVADLGDQPFVDQPNLSGTFGQYKRMEAFTIELVGAPEGLGLEYKTHIQNLGWEKEYIQSPNQSGTTGNALRMEAIQIKLTGEKAAQYDVYYQVHAQNFGWLPWAMNDAKSGTAGYAYQLEAIRVMVVPAGEKPVDAFLPVNSSTVDAFQTGPLDTVG